SQPAAGWQFSRWNADCVSVPVAFGQCVLEMTKDTAATVTFTTASPPPPPPPPLDECAGLTPMATPAPVTVHLDGMCLTATGDAAIDPSGGTAIVDSHLVNGKWVMTYQRYDKAGDLQGGEVSIDDTDTKAVSRVGVDLRGNVLVLAADGNQHTWARWLSRDGA